MSTPYRHLNSKTTNSHKAYKEVVKFFFFKLAQPPTKLGFHGNTKETFKYQKMKSALQLELQDLHGLPYFAGIIWFVLLGICLIAIVFYLFQKITNPKE